MGKFITFFYKRPLMVKLVLIFIILLSIVSVMRIKRLAMPNVDMRAVSIITTYPGASPEDVELNVTIKLEDAIKEVDGVDTYSSKSIENMSIIIVELDADNYDIEKVKTDLRRVIDSVTDLPEAVTEKPDFREESMEKFPVFEVAISHKDNDKEKLLFHAKNLRKRLLKTESVSKVEFDSVPVKEIQVLLNRQKMKDLYVSFSEVISAIENNNIKVSGGSLESFTKEKSIVTFSEFEDPKDIENIIVRAGEFVSNEIRIKDIGEVEWGFEKQTIITKFNGLEGASVAIVKKPDADVLTAINKEWKPVIEQYKKDYANDGVSIVTFDDDSLETKQRLSIVYSNAIVGFILVIIVLFVFLDRNIALWTAAGIPISIGLTMIMLPVFGVTINAISICGLVVVLGMVVDDAIIISESIYREREKGASSLEASIIGLKKVIMPVMGTILTTIIAFCPMYFIPGMVGDFSVEIPTIVIIMLLASFIEATMILPIHLAESKSDIKTHRKPVGHKLFTLFERIYIKFLSISLKNKNKSLAAIILVFFLGGGFSVFFMSNHFNMFPTEQAYQMFLFGTSAKGSNINFTYEQIKDIENIIEKLPEDVLISYGTIVGEDVMEEVRSTNAFSIFLTLSPAMSRDMTADDVKKHLQAEIEKLDLKGIEDVKYFIYGGGPPVGKPLEVRLIGNDREQARVILKEMEEYLSQIGVIDIEVTKYSGKEELRLIPNYQNIARANLSVAQIATTIRTAINGSVVSYLNTPEDRYAFRVMLDEESKDYENPIQGLSVRNNLGRLVSIDELVVQKATKAPANIYHFDGDRVNTIFGSIDRDKTTAKEVYKKVKEKYKDLDKQYPGFSLNIGGEAEESSKTFMQMMMALGVAIIAIYFILVMQFNSFLQPGIVILAIPFGLIGICIAFFVQSQDLSMMALIGILGFSGVVINASLIMVEFINSLIRENKFTEEKDIIAAVIDGARVRLRPIMLTTITTVVGLTPTAYGWIGGFDYFISPMVLAMAWGLIVGTTTTLLIIPVFYLHLHKIITFFRKLFRIQEA